MLKSLGIQYVVVGHSERREYFQEDNALLAKKTQKVLESGLTPIYCCGEKLESREAGEHLSVNKQQIEEGLFALSTDQIKQVVVVLDLPSKPSELISPNPMIL